VHSYAVEQSIAAQVERFHPDVQAPAGNLRSLLEACASHYKKLGKPFVVVLDGLDHVWRINAADKRPLDDVFSEVIPCPDNMVLLVGTQPVDDVQLPTDLLAAAPKAEWRTLPTMSENAVLSYLLKAVQEGRLTTGFGEVDQAERQLQEAATAIRTRTNGHPLHVIYATAELEHTHRSLSQWDIERLTGDLSKDAKFYYASLWEGLSPKPQGHVKTRLFPAVFLAQSRIRRDRCESRRCAAGRRQSGAPASLFGGGPEGFPRESRGFRACDRRLLRPHQRAHACSGRLVGELCTDLTTRELALDGPSKAG
jgi:hypothetical protein